jgi:archaemetzincin
MKRFGIVLVCVLLAGCSQPERVVTNSSTAPARDKSVSELSKKKDPLAKFFKPMTEVVGDWLTHHPEDGETFEEYIESRPTLPTADRNTIYILPIGNFSPVEMKIIRLTAEYMRAFYDLPVVLKDRKPLGNVPKEMVRVQYPNNRQIRTSYFVDDLLPAILPKDAAALICLTSNDLYPGETWNFVFGQASLEKRVGVWSLWRLEKEGGKPVDKNLFLDRTLKVAMHETGHMFSMRHCTKYECLMSGTNHLAETDRRPLDTCPECTMKIAWGMNYPLADRYKNLAEFWRKQNRPDEQKRMLEKANAIR